MAMNELGLASRIEKSKVRILYVDDEENNLVALKATFRPYFTIFTALSAAEGRKILETEEINIIITDQRMPEETGIEFLESIMESYPDPIRMLLTGYADIEAVINAINRCSVFRYITKPWDERELSITIMNAYEVFDLRAKNKKLTADLIKANDQLEFMLRQSMLS